MNKQFSECSNPVIQPISIFPDLFLGILILCTCICIYMNRHIIVHVSTYIFTYTQNNCIFGVYDYMDIILWYTRASSIWLVRSSYTFCPQQGLTLIRNHPQMGVFPSWKSANTTNQSKIFSLVSQLLTFISTPLRTHT